MQPKPKIDTIKQTACQLFFSSFSTFFLFQVKKFVFLMVFAETQTLGRQNLAEILGMRGRDFAAPLSQEGVGQPNCCSSKLKTLLGKALACAKMAVLDSLSICCVANLDASEA